MSFSCQATKAVLGPTLPPSYFTKQSMKLMQNRQVVLPLFKKDRR